MVTTIGSLANVPNPGAPVASAWAQDVTRQTVHRFASKAALDAATWPGLSDGALAITLDTGRMWQRAGGAWAPFRAALGLVAAPGVVTTPKPTGISNAIVDIGGMAVTWNAVAGRYYRGTIFIPAIGSTVAQDILEITLREGAATLAAAIGIAYTTLVAWPGMTLQWVQQLTAGAHTWKCSAQRVAGTGLMNIETTATRPAMITVEDIGP